MKNISSTFRHTTHKYNFDKTVRNKKKTIENNNNEIK